MDKQQLTAADIIAIGNHGQTIRHRPASTEQSYPFTLQIGCNQTLACLTNINVIGDFRQKDIALGGQGAPLVPPFHQLLLSEQQQDSFIVNIGGIANITYLPADKSKPVLGFDTGPGNGLLDAWYQQHHHNSSMDTNGDWANSGTINNHLLDQLIADPYFAKTLPKSTGREYFNLAWLNSHLGKHKLAANDIQTTLTALTAQSIANGITSLSQSGNIYLCGGGVYNRCLVAQLNANLTGFTIGNINALGVDSDSLEAMAFAWLAYAYNHKLPSNLPSVTGASRATTLGTQFSY